MSRNEMVDIQQSLGELQKDSGILYLILLTTLGISIAGIVMAAYLFTLLRFRKGMVGGPNNKFPN